MVRLSPSATLIGRRSRPAAIGARTMLLDRCVADDLRLVGFHLPDGGMGRVEVDGDGYRVVGV